MSAYYDLDIGQYVWLAVKAWTPLAVCILMTVLAVTKGSR